jgi:hypothetical protein
MRLTPQTGDYVRVRNRETRPYDEGRILYAGESEAYCQWNHGPASWDWLGAYDVLERAHD